LKKYVNVIYPEGLHSSPKKTRPSREKEAMEWTKHAILK
jgi:hypothetical protein